MSKSIIKAADQFSDLFLRFFRGGFHLRLPDNVPRGHLRQQLELTERKLLPAMEALNNLILYLEKDNSTTDEKATQDVGVHGRIVGSLYDVPDQVVLDEGQVKTSPSQSEPTTDLSTVQRQISLPKTKVKSENPKPVLNGRVSQDSSVMSLDHGADDHVYLGSSVKLISLSRAASINRKSLIGLRRQRIPSPPRLQRPKFVSRSLKNVPRLTRFHKRILVEYEDF
ncbi:hypothetical protein CAPTEDRAFT_201914 [Capitella teleta]|uniref:Uncharacterized protein n=1 Tax=Capitella teleta TaxID=283909 RepID=R7TCA2_CAPTE|nr:hypothetical protein CAPTEDRAFT_201914 [Capitella teleta]|eukprot:ELT91338.1 hypothetical protein CAPTEDRAFT_201914 [Capitella teleta]